MRRTAARIGVVTALALSMSITTVNAPSAHAEEPGLVSVARADSDEMNYVINLADTNPEDLRRVLALVPGTGSAALISYPKTGTFLTQSATSSLAPNLAAALWQAGISVHSTGPTRVASALYYGRVDLPTGKKDGAPQPSAAGGLDAMCNETASTASAEANEEIFNWGATAMHAREAEVVNAKCALVTVAVVDFGVEDTHLDLEGRVDTSRPVKCSVNGVAMQDFYGWRDEFYRGTHVVGAVATDHSGIGIDGITPESTIIAIQATDDNRLIYPEYVACAFMRAASHGMDIANNSYSMDPWIYWSPTDPEQAVGLEAATRSIKYAQDKGLTVIAATGDEGVDTDNPTIDNRSPTDVPIPTENRAVEGSIRVPSILDGATRMSAIGQVYNTKPDLSLGRIESSNYGQTIDLAVPDDQIYSTATTLFYRSDYTVADGTSMTIPHVPGIVALIKPVHPELTGAQAIDLMKKQAAANYGRLSAPVDDKEYHGYGFLDALDAVSGGQDQVDEAKAGTRMKDMTGQWYRYQDGSYPTSAAIAIGGATCRFNTRGYMVIGWARETGQWLFHRVLGTRTSGWMQVEGTWYYLDPATGVTATGWMLVDDTWYYLSASSAMGTGWVRGGSIWYYLTLFGGMTVGWLHEGDSWYYLGSSGTMVIGTQQVDGTIHTFGPDGRLRHQAERRHHGGAMYLRVRGPAALSGGLACAHGEWLPDSVAFVEVMADLSWSILWRVTN